MKCNASVDLLYVSASKVCILLYFFKKRTVNYVLKFLIAQKHFNIPYYSTHASRNISMETGPSLYYRIWYFVSQEYTETLDEHYIVIITEI